MYIHESLAVLLGMPFVIAIVFVALIIVLLWAMKNFDAPSNSACTQDCVQGRYCTCGPREADMAKNCPAWPFPCDKIQIEPQHRAAN